MPGILCGKFLWVLDPKDCGGVDRIISVAQDTGYGVCAKFHDGDPADDAKYGFQRDFAALADLCAPLGIPLIAWGYCYADTYGNLDKEAAAAALSLKCGAQAYVIDAEMEWEIEGSNQWATRFMTALLTAAPGAEVGLTTFWNLRWHPKFPAKAFRDAGCVAALPQVYYRLAGRSTIGERRAMHAISTADFGAAGYAVTCPVGELTENAGDTRDFLDIVGPGPHSFWLLDGNQDSEGLKALSRPRSPS
ncbi:MAG: hypothetical protein ACM3WU_10290 [Bacillota bacterium]